MPKPVIHSRVRRRYRAGARIVLLLTLLIGAAASSQFGSEPGQEAQISKQRPARPARSHAEPAALVPEPEILPASLPARHTTVSAGSEGTLQLDRRIEFVPPLAPAVERLIL